MAKRLIYLIRHGEIDSDGKKRFIGQTDLPLSEAGLCQARLLQGAIDGLRISGIYCSDLQRSLKTAAIIASKQQIKPVARADLREISLGEWEGRTFEEIRSKYPGEFAKRGEAIATYRPVGGESFLDCSRRVVNAFNDILSSSTGDVLIVGHAGVNRLILSFVLGLPIENIFQFSQEYGCMNLISHEKSGFRLELLNMIAKDEHIGLLAPRRQFY